VTRIGMLAQASDLDAGQHAVLIGENDADSARRGIEAEQQHQLFLDAIAPSS
jgi:hypothetical protein